MTTIERPYWPHSDPEPPDAPVSLRTGYTAQPLSHCLNGCQAHHGDAASPKPCEPPYLICSTGRHNCLDRLDTWLREIPEHYGRLLWVKDHGTVQAEPGTKATKRPDPPAPMRLEVVDLLDQRAKRGVLGIVHSWADNVRDQRRYTPEWTPTVAGECRLLVANLPWVAERDWVVDLYDEIRTLHRTLADAVGEYRAKPVGKCERLVDTEDGAPGVCGGALVRDTEDGGGHGVKCLSCRKKYAADNELRELGLVVGRMLREEAS